ncbi:cytochrome P450 4V2-like isoform X2 [Malaya genurostris]|uniref:cytochrome P450 4V2-like isoform X2 n=1 Tax=Malaya genurostris TaxID=325434 RepID=UPI0026F3E4AD|nr:cytochrome P450 4V2-like isoform X2 [Malaya genurostris]
MWIILLGFLVVLCVVQYISFRKKYAFSKDIPCVEMNYPLIGCGHLFIGKGTAKRFWNIVKLFKRKDKLFKFWMGPKLILATSHPDVAQQILTESVWLDKPFLYDFFEMSHGLFGAKYQMWKGQRKALSSSFNLRILQSFIPIFTNCSKKLVERLGTFPEGATVNIMEHVERFAMEMVLETTLGLDISVLEEADSLIVKIERYFYLTSRRLLSVHHYLDAIYHWSGVYRELRSLLNYLDRVVLRIVGDVSVRHANVDEKPIEADEEFKKPQIFVDEMFTNKMRQFTEREIIDNVYTIIGAGTDTSATAVAYACLLLALYPDVQQKLYDEVIQVYPSSDPEFTLDSLKNLEYTEMVLKEALRLYPVAPIIMRQNLDQTQIDGLKVPMGNLLVIHIYSLHRREDVWGPDAAKFDPERFSAERSKARHPFAFLAFSGGSRNCLRYAYISMKIMMAAMVKKFRFTTKLREEDLRFKFDAILRLENEHLVQLERR